MEHIFNAFEELGVSRKLTSLYIALLGLGEATVSEIAKESNIKRPTAYILLEDLKTKGMASCFERQGIIRYSPINPQKVLEKMKTNQLFLESKIPEMFSFLKKNAIVPKVEIFEGKQALKNIYEYTLLSKNELCVIFNPFAFFLKQKEYVALDNWHTHERVKRKIHARLIVPENDRGRSFAKAKVPYRKVRLLDPAKYPFEDIIVISDQYLLSYSFEEKIGIAIRSSMLSKNQRYMFELAWQQAKDVRD